MRVRASGQVREGQRTADLEDALVGKRICLKRKLLGLSQQALARQLGISFQQIQKYEKGLNRVSAGKLKQIATVLDVPIRYFFTTSNAGAEQKDDGVSDLLNDPDTVSMLLAFSQIRGRGLRKLLIEHARKIAELDAQNS